MTAPRAHFDGRDWPWPASRIGTVVRLPCVNCHTEQDFTITELVSPYGWVCAATHAPCTGNLIQRYDFAVPGCPEPTGNEAADRLNRELVRAWRRDLEQRNPRQRAHGRKRLAQVDAGVEPRMVARGVLVP